MTIQIAGFKAYTDALQNFTRAEQKFQSQNPTADQKNSSKAEFADVLSSSLEKVNDLQSDRTALVNSFAAGQSQNVHELMIAMQKASLAMSMTSAVRNKVIEAYKELARMQF